MNTHPLNLIFMKTTDLNLEGTYIELSATCNKEEIKNEIGNEVWY